jgi:predicted N-acetyltransferase YhbS
VLVVTERLHYTGAAQRIGGDQLMSSANHKDLQIRAARPADLDAINDVIERAVMSWKLAERVKRLSLPMYRYDAVDFGVLETVVAEHGNGRIVGVAAWEPGQAVDAPAGATAILLHGLYVDPGHHRKGVGSRLLAAAERAAREQGADGLLVKAQRDAEPFFLGRGFEPLPAAADGEHYPHRLWKALPTG